MVLEYFTKINHKDFTKSDILISVKICDLIKEMIKMKSIDMEILIERFRQIYSLRTINAFCELLSLSKNFDNFYTKSNNLFNDYFGENINYFFDFYKGYKIVVLKKLIETYTTNEKEL